MPTMDRERRNFGQTNSDNDPQQIAESRLEALRHQAVSRATLTGISTGASTLYAPPYDRGDVSAHKILYMAYPYDRGDDTTSIQPKFCFVFPVPAGITDSVTNEYDDEGGFLKRVLGAAFTGGNALDAAGKEFGRVIDNFAGDFQRGGASFEQNEFYYKGTAKREFSFSHKMTPLSYDQSNEMKEIVDNLTRMSLPSTGGNPHAVRVTSPAEWEIHFLSNGVDNPFLPKIGRCILETVSVNNTPNESFQPSKRNYYPNDVDIELSFKEILIRTREDV